MISIKGRKKFKRKAGKFRSIWEFKGMVIRLGTRKIIKIMKKIFSAEWKRNELK